MVINKEASKYFLEAQLIQKNDTRKNGWNAVRKP